MQIRISGLQGATSLELVSFTTRKVSSDELAAILVQTALTREQQKDILVKRGMSEATAEVALNTELLALQQGKAVVQTDLLALAYGKLTTTLKGLWATIKAHPYVAIAAAVAAAIGLIIAGNEKAQAEIKESIEKSAKSAVSLAKSLDEINDYKDKVDELNKSLNNDSLSQSEATEKRKQLLQIQEELIKKYGKEKEVVESITDAINGESNALDGLSRSAAKKYLQDEQTAVANAQNYLSSNELVTLKWNSDVTDYNDSVVEELIKSFVHSSDIAKRNTDFNTGKETNYSFHLDFYGTRDEIVSEYDKFYDYVNSYLTEHNQELSDTAKNQLKKLLSGISSSQSSIADSTYDDSHETLNKAAESALLVDENYSKLYSDYLKKRETLKDAIAEDDQDLISQSYDDFHNAYSALFENITYDVGNVNADSIKKWFEDTQTEFDNQIKNTELTLRIPATLKLDSSQTKNAINYISGISITSNDIEFAKAIAQQKGIDTFATMDSRGIPLEKVQEANGITIEQAKAYNYVKIAADELGVSIDDLVVAFEKLGYIQKEVAEGSESSFALSKDQTKELKSVHSDVDKLNKAYQNLFAGKLTTNDVAELVDLFPTLGEYVDWTDEKFGNLAEGIDKVIKERPQELISQLEEVLNTQDLSDEAKKSIQSMIAALKQLKPELKDTKTLIEDIQKAIKGVSSSISTLIGFTKEISSDGALSLSSIDTIMTDDTYQSLRPYINDMEGMKTAITELTNKQKDAYEDLYNAEMYEKDYEAYHKAVQQKEQENENLLSDSVKQIEDEIKYFNDAYDVDITNWDTFTDTKKNILQNTNAELLSKQNKLINDFANSYGVDLRNFAKAADAKQAVLENLEKSKAAQDVRDYLNEHTELGADWAAHSPSSAIPENVQDEVSKLLSGVMSFEAWQDWERNGTLSTIAGNEIQKSIEKIIKGFTISPVDWDKMTANIKSTGSSSSSSKNYIDWIERRLKKFAQNTKEVFARVADYISFNNQNSQLRKAINAIRDEIAVNEQSYQYYMEEANKVGLDPYWQWFVQNGARNISDIQDEALREKISRYKELYDNAINCKNAVEDLKKTEKEYANQMLSNVEKYYSNRIDYANQDAEYYNSLDTDNQNINKNYNAIRKSYNEQISYTQKEHGDLLNTLNSLVSNGSIKYQSDEWYEWWAKIQKCNVEVRNLKKSIHDLANEELQNIQGYWDNRIGVYDNTISYINTVGGDTTRKGSKNYKGLSRAYNSQIGYTNKQVSELQTRLNKAVKAGDIEKYSDKWYEWTGIIEQSKEKVVELQTSIHQLAVEQFEEIQKNYNNQLSLYEHTAKEYENKNKEIETRGLLANSKYYAKLQTNESNNITILKRQAKDLENSLNQAVKSGNIEVGSEEWYKMRDAILSVNEEIDESNLKLLEYAKTIREIGWEVFSFLQDRISQLTTESDFLIDLMSNSKLFDDSGNITAKGRATMGLHTQNYNVYMAQAEQYANEIRKVNAQLAKDPHNSDIIKHREELLGLQQKSILAAKKEKKAIIDLTKEGFDAQLKSLKKLIETYTKSLDAAKSLYDYQKNINDKTSNIAKLQKQLNAYQGDNSEEAQARIQQLQTELKEAQEDLQQTEYEKLISDTKSLLDDLYDDYEETINNRLDNVDALISDMIGVVNSNSVDINNTIKASATEVGAILSNEMTDIWTGKGAVNGNIVSNYYNGFDTKLTSVQTTLNNISSYVSTLARAGEKDNKSTTSTTVKPTNTATTNKYSTPQGTKNTTSTTKTSTPSRATNGSNSKNTTSTAKASTPSGTANDSNSKNTTNDANETTNTNKPQSNTNSSKQRTDKENYGVALAIINGNYGWGSGDIRKKNLIAKGFNYNTVQGIVNKLWKEGYVKTGAWKGKYYGISDLSPYAYKKFKSGGLVDYTGIAQVDGTPMKPESFLNADDTQNMADLRDTLRELAARPITMANGIGALGMFGGTVTPNILDLSQKLQALSGSDMVQNLNVHNENHIEIGIDKVEDYNDFITKIQKDRKFENIIQDMTFGRMNGGSSLAKYRH